jgi:hypothetical protein
MTILIVMLMVILLAACTTQRPAPWTRTAATLITLLSPYWVYAYTP